MKKNDFGELTTETINALTAEALDETLPPAIKEAISKSEGLAVHVGVAMCYTSKKAEIARSLKMSPDTLYKKFDNPAFARQVDHIRGLMLEYMVSNALELGHAVLEKFLMQAILVKIQGLSSSDERLRQKVATEIIHQVAGKPSAIQRDDDGNKQAPQNIFFIHEGIHPDMLEREVIDLTPKE